MKRMLAMFMLLMISSVDVNVEPYSKTGHDQFSDVSFVEDGRLLIDITDAELEVEYSKLKTRFMGWRYGWMQVYKDATFVGSVVFSRSNKTSEPYIFNYDFSTITYDALSINVKGSMTVKASAKIKMVELTGSQEGSISLDIERSIKTTEGSSMKITVYPNKKMTLRISGTAKVTNGVGKNYFFWMNTKKGAFETIDIVSCYYELVEEDV